MKKVVGFLQKIANFILGVTILATVGVLLYAKFGNGKTLDLSKFSLSKNDTEVVVENASGESDQNDNGLNFDPNNTTTAEDVLENNGQNNNELNVVSPVGEQSEFVNQIPELEQGDSPVSNLDISQIQDASKSRPTIIHSGEEAVSYVKNLLDDTARFSGDGIYDVNGENYYKVNSMDSEGIFYVSPFGEIHFYSRTGEWIELDPYEPEVTSYSGYYTLEGDMYQSGNCLTFLGFRHDMTFREVMNKLIRNSGVNDTLIEDYKDTIYYTTARFSTDKVLADYDNIEILDKMGDYYFEGFPIHLNLKFNAQVTGVTEESRLNSSLMEIRARLYNLESNVPQCAYKTDLLLEKLEKTYGKPTSEVHNKFAKSYTFTFGEDVMVVNTQRTVLGNKEYWYMGSFELLRNYDWR